jgi:hypothetical protein
MKKITGNIISKFAGKLQLSEMIASKNLEL